MQAAKAPRKLCESKPGLYKKVIGVFEAAHLAEVIHYIARIIATLQVPDKLTNIVSLRWCSR